MGALSVTPKKPAREPFEPLVPGTEVLPYDDVGALQKGLSPEFAAVIVEVVQGEGGLTAMTPDFAAALNEECRKHDIILIADEVQTGLRRTGSLFAGTHVGLEPDIITMSKPLAGGLPLSATLIPAKINDQLRPGDHGTTFGGGPVTTALATQVWKTISSASFEARLQGTIAYFDEALQSLAAKFAFIPEVRGRGMLRGLVIEADAGGADAVKAIMNACREKGLLVLKSGDNVVRLAPPLVISKKEIDAGIAVLETVLSDPATTAQGAQT
jgi:acetylornithine/N-succinyldiaminopimelate aminotransferase